MSRAAGRNNALWMPTTPCDALRRPVTPFGAPINENVSFSPNAPAKICTMITAAVHVDLRYTQPDFW